MKKKIKQLKYDLPNVDVGQLIVLGLKDDMRVIINNLISIYSGKDRYDKEEINLMHGLLDSYRDIIKYHGDVPVDVPAPLQKWLIQELDL